MKGFFKGCLIAVLVLIFLLAIAGFLGWKYLSKSSSPKNTTIQILTGSVLRNNKEISDGEALIVSDTIKTNPQSQAVILFENGSELTLDENTQITLSQSNSNNISILQTIGKTWSRVKKMTGKNESYEIETPTALATVRGTAFQTEVGTDTTNIDTDEGTVEVAEIEILPNKERKIIRKLLVEAGFGTTLKKGDKEFLKRKIREEIRNSRWFEKNRKKAKSENANTSYLSDLAKLKRLADRARNKDLNLSSEQLNQIEPIANKYKNFDGKITPEIAQDAANVLYIIDPVEFSDKEHWVDMVLKAAPLIEKFKSNNF